MADPIRDSYPAYDFLPSPLRHPLVPLLCTEEMRQTDSGAAGSLGWKIRGSLDAAFEKAAYELEPSTTANPKYVEVKTGHGYHIIMVEGRK